MSIHHLSGGKLDYWVARILALNGVRLEPDGTCTYIDSSLSIGVRVPFFPSVDWTHGGPIIDREGIGTWRYNDQWQAAYGDPVRALEISGPDGTGPTPLIAAMRAYVASKFGDEVPDNE
ncbi:phage protein NinX family protein [Burkholderia ambifaria]|uniref:phage protein NinX family protein n=1 Tax=Burkholderia ambifaria TaxID=152480 RepID=UPI001B9D5490|nr:phage protein NinX family protein [Burkholderia ambifaria]MBR8221290.1 DUF2591 family protein [Burkholderia ambifaria]